MISRVNRLGLVLVILLSGCGAWDSLFGEEKPAQLGPDRNCPTGNCPVATNGDAGAGAAEAVCPRDPSLVMAVMQPPACTTDADCIRLGNGCDIAAGKCRPRRCEWNDQCPAGAYCERSRGECAATCLDGVVNCGSGTCGCDGRCTGQAAEGPTLRAFGLSVSPGDLVITEGPTAQWQRSLEITLETRDVGLLSGDGAVRTGRASVNVEPGFNLRVACSTNATPTSFAERCTYDGVGGEWLFQKVGDRWVATGKVVVAPAPGLSQAPDDSGWYVRLYSPSAGGKPAFVNVSFGSDVPSTVWTDVTAISNLPGKAYSGFVIVTTSADRVPGPERSHNAELKLPVRVVPRSSCGEGIGACLVVYEPTGTLSSSQALIVRLDRQRGRQRLSEEGLLTDVKLLSLKRHNNSGLLFGVIESKNWMGSDYGGGNENRVFSHDVRVTLSASPEAECGPSSNCEAGLTCRDGACLSCATNRDCSEGEVCFGGLCLAAPPMMPTSSGGPAYSLLTEGASSSWVGPVLTINDQGVTGSSPIMGKRVYATGGPFSSPEEIRPVEMLAAWAFESLPGRFDGQNCGEGFVDWVAKHRAQHGGADTLFSCRAGGCPACRDGTCLCAGTSDPSRVCEPRQRCIPADSIICVDPVSDDGMHRLEATQGASADCERLYANIRASVPDDLPADYRSFCTDTGYIARFTVNGPLHTVRACTRWRDAYLWYGLADERSRREADAERGLCYDAAIVASNFELLSNRFQRSVGQLGQPFLSFSGDLRCATDEDPRNDPAEAKFRVPHAVDLLQHPDATSSSDRQNAASLLRTCISELTTPPIEGALAQEFQPGTCFSRASFDYGLATARSGAGDQSNTRLYMRLLQMWLAMHGFIASQGLEELKLSQVEAGAKALPEPSPGTPTPPEPVDPNTVLSTLEKGLLRVAVQPFVTSGSETLGLADDVLRDADYRRQLDSSYDPTAWQHHEQPLGVAPAMLETATSYLRYVEAYFETQQMASFAKITSGARVPEYDSARRTVGRALRLAKLVERLSSALYEKALGTPVPCVEPETGVASCPGKCIQTSNGEGICSAVPWAGRWLRARDAYLELRARLAARSASNDNPLGIDERDLPLFFGDLQGTNSRFFASSDYLMNTWALSAVASAQAALQTARDAWMSARNSKRQDQDRNAEQSRRFEAIKRQHGAVIADACGFPPNERVEGLLTKYNKGLPEDCYLDLDRKIDDKYVCRSPKTADAGSLANRKTAAEPSGGDINAAFAAQKALSRCVAQKLATVAREYLSETSFATSGGNWRSPDADSECRAYFLSNPAAQTGNALFYSGPFLAAPVGQGSPWPDSRPCEVGETFWRDGKPVACASQSGRYCYYKMPFEHRLILQWWAKRLPDGNWLRCAPRENDCQPPPSSVREVLADESSLTDKERSQPLTPAFCFAAAVRTVKCNRDLFDAAVEKATRSIAGSLSPDNEALIAECREDLQSTDEASVEVLPLPDLCYRGRLGSAFVRLHAAQQDVQLAKRAWADALALYEISGKACAKLEELDAAIQDRTAAFRQQMKKLRAAKATADAFAAVASSVSFGAGGPSVNLGGLASLRSQALERAMQVANEDYQSFLQTYAQKEKIFLCYNELEKQRAVFETQKQQIMRRTVDAQAAAVEFGNARREAERALADGLHAWERESGRVTPGYAHHYWYEEKAERFLREFKWAKRLTYLVLRAVEYEFQQSLPLREQILTATHPDQLEGALRTMQRDVATRAINRRRPEEQSVVLSLREDLLGIGDRSEAPAGERRLAPAEILQGRLWDPRYAVYDESGKWLGQAIPFTLKDYGVLKNRCAERVWRVNATVQGDGLSERAPGAPVMLLKRNTFSSQWCEGRGDGTSYQVGHVQPSRNLFKEGVNEIAAGETDAFSVASVFPWFNVRRADFFKAEYRNGASEELAGRGLYGDYMLLFPREMLVGDTLPIPGARDVGKLPAARFPLERVEDVLLRFDYLSVDDFSGVSTANVRVDHNAN